MPENKHALTRYHVLDKCFSNPVKRYFIEDLISACNERLSEINPTSRGVSRRTVFDDIKYMESSEGYNATINRVPIGKRVYYRYSDIKFSIDNQPLNQSELEQIKAAMEILTRFDGMPQFEWLGEIAPKLEQAFLMEKGSPAIIGFDNNHYLEGIDHLGKLFHQILYKRPLCVTYRSYKREVPADFIVHPYFLKQYNNRWFLFCLNHNLDKLSNLALDRIIDIKEEPIEYVPNTTYDFNEHFDEIVGVTIPDDGIVEKIILRFTNDSAPYIITKPLHGSQKKIFQDDKGVLFSIEVIPNYELESLILSFGEKAEIIEPANFKEKIAVRLREASSLYYAP